MVHGTLHAYEPRIHGTPHGTPKGAPRRRRVTPGRRVSLRHAALAGLLATAWVLLPPPFPAIAQEAPAPDEGILPPLLPPPAPEAEAPAPETTTETAPTPTTGTTPAESPAPATPEAAPETVAPAAETAPEAAPTTTEAPATPAEDTQTTETTPPVEAESPTPVEAPTAEVPAPAPASPPAEAAEAAPPAPAPEAAAKPTPKPATKAAPAPEAFTEGPPVPKKNWSKVKNPVATTQESITRGRALYTGKGLCNICHGDKGDGFGPVRGQFNPLPNAFFDPAWQKSMNDGELMGVLQDGKYGTGMIRVVPDFLSESEGWDVINYIRTLKGKTTEAYERARAGGGPAPPKTGASGDQGSAAKPDEAAPAGTEPAGEATP